MIDWIEAAKLAGIGYVAVSAAVYSAYLVFQTLRR